EKQPARKQSPLPLPPASRNSSVRRAGNHRRTMEQPREYSIAASGRFRDHMDRRDESSYARSQSAQTRNSTAFPIHFGIGPPDVVCVEMQCVYHVAANRLGIPELANKRREHVRYHLNPATTQILALHRRADYLRLGACDKQPAGSLPLWSQRL